MQGVRGEKEGGNTKKDKENEERLEKMKKRARNATVVNPNNRQRKD